jgi:hypothetical protein
VVGGKRACPGWKRLGPSGQELQRRAASTTVASSILEDRCQGGIFTQEDPIGYAGGINLYGYVGNNPVMYMDPFGLCADSLHDAEGRCPGGLTDHEFDAVEQAAKEHLSRVARDRVLAALYEGRIRGGNIHNDEAHVSPFKPDIIVLNRSLAWAPGITVSIFNNDSYSLAEKLAHEDRHVQMNAQLGLVVRVGLRMYHNDLMEADAWSYARANVIP